MTYSKEFRKLVLKTKDKEGLTFQETAKRFSIGTTTLVRWVKNPTPKTTRNKPPTKIDMEKLRQDVEQYPDSYRYERAERLGVSTTCVQYALKRLRVTYKKNPYASQSGSRKKISVLPNNKEISTRR